MVADPFGRGRERRMHAGKPLTMIHLPRIRRHPLKAPPPNQIKKGARFHGMALATIYYNAWTKTP